MKEISELNLPADLRYADDHEKRGDGVEITRFYPFGGILGI